ncbi:E3 ubiquitin-protein ligase RNF4-like [Balearica regulorum gibbericeps]|uniref:E3 ubiquitin-protein ligase RNF4-like n=1 Tax=Balearica regulorum gibbericeps TaxID=100784 RepID=UPI003F5F1D82
MSTTQRKRRGGAVHSRQARKRNRLMASTAEMASEAEPIELEESAGEEVVDLTCESSEPVVVDLTHDDSLVSGFVLSPARPSGTVSCPICMDGYSEIVQSGRLIVSTKCGHVFCSQCLRDSLRNANSCPTCRKKLTHRQYHPIYI